MKLNLLKPNAHYDMVHGEPLPIEHDNDGSTIVRYNIEPEMGIPEGKKKEVQIGWQCYEVVTFEQPTKENLKKVTIRSVIDETEEFALVNSYNKHVLAIVRDEKAVVEYKAYLQFTEDLDVALLEIMSN